MLSCSGAGALGGWQQNDGPPKPSGSPFQETPNMFSYSSRLCRCDGVKGLVWGAYPG